MPVELNSNFIWYNQFFLRAARVLQSHSNELILLIHEHYFDYETNQIHDNSAVQFGCDAFGITSDTFANSIPDRQFVAQFI